MYCRLLAVRSSTATRTNLVKHAARNGGENATSRSASGKPTHYKPSTMSEMPQPQGSWARVNAQRQSKYNMHLLAGLGFTGLTLFAGYQTGAFFLNPGPELAKTEINVVTHKQVREKVAEPEPEDFPPVEVMEIALESPAAEPEVPPAAVEEAAAAPPAEEGEAPASSEQVLAEAVVEAVVEAVAEAAVEVAAEAVVAAAEVVETAATEASEPVIVDDPPTPPPPSPVAEVTEPVAEEGESAVESVAEAEAAAAPSAEAKEEA